MSDDAELLEAYVRRGDVPSLTALVQRHTRWLRAFFRGQMPTETDVEDVFQETWLKVIRSCGSYRGGSVRAYLACVARSTAIDWYRRRGQPLESLDAADEGESPAERLVAGQPPPSEVLAAADDLESVRRAVRLLPPGPRQVFLMRLEGKLTFEEIAKVLEVPLGTALTWMRTATTRLKKRMGGV